MTKKIQPQAAAARTQVREVKILNRFGIHARPAALFVKTAGQFVCDITVEKGGSVVSGKSIMGLLTIEGSKGSVLKLTASGADAAEALEALVDLVERKFFED